jgi:hypothetical protein
MGFPRVVSGVFILTMLRVFFWVLPVPGGGVCVENRVVGLQKINPTLGKYETNCAFLTQNVLVFKN